MNDNFFDITKTTRLSTVAGIGDNSELAKVDRLAELARQINADHEEAVGLVGEAAGTVARCGELLLEARKLVPPGQWHKWLKDNTKVTVRCAQKWMQLARDEEHTVWLAQAAAATLQRGIQ
jgi:hypothetical protein